MLVENCETAGLTVYGMCDWEQLCDLILVAALWTQVLNEVVVDRGASPYLCQLDLYVQGRQVTIVQGDGK